jgi:dipeptidyl aminopeptidase/acylaminoacyl peptidase
VARHYSATSPCELVRFTQDAKSPGDLASLTHVWDHTKLDPSHLTPAEDFRWRSEDGLEIQGWLYRAQPNPERAIIYIHGGPTWHSEDDVNAQIQYLVSRGFNVLDVNYRGSTGFGLKFREAIKEDGWGGREQVDIAAGAEALIRAGLAVPGRVGVTGTSYGGYSAWFQITHYPPEIIAAAAPICGMTDLVVDYDTTRPDIRPYSEEMMGGSPDQVPERYYDRSPINYVEKIQGQLLIVQGAQDPNVTPENVRQVAERLDTNRIPYRLLIFEDEGHGINKLVNQERLYLRLASFFDSALT